VGRPTPAAQRVVESEHPVDPARTLRLHQLGRRDESIRVEEGAIAFASRTRAGAVVVRLAPLDRHRVRVQGWGPGAEHAVERAEWLLGLDDDPTRFDPAAGGAVDPRVAKRIRRLARAQEGARLGRCLSLFEVVVRTVLQQRVTWIEATRARRWLTRRYGEPAPLPELWLPPDPRKLAAAPYYALHPAGVERSRAKTLRTLAGRAAAIDDIARLPTEEAKAALFALPGIGGWSTGMIAGFGLGDPDAVPVGDFHLPNVVSSFVAGEPRGDDERMLALLKPWKGHRFRLLRLLFDGGVHAERRGPKNAPSKWTRDPRH
jgi:3-methyladenine DNA glycosylase/8-oxoguanine DNA glycosylase